MLYYLVSLLKSPLNPLTYQSKDSLEKGALVRVSLNKKEYDGVVLEEVSEPGFSCEPIILTCNVYFSQETLSIAKFMAEYYVCSLGEVLQLFVPKTKAETKAPALVQTHITLSSSQQNAFDFILSHKRSLLFGDTGSGKTEVYMKLFEKTINEGKRALFLMPEIGLTPQMKQRLKEHFGAHVAIWHSKITLKKKAQIREALSSGEISIIAGTRSALFLPIDNLGLIVVDEEHDESYKSSSRPRYNAKDVALLFAQKMNARVVLGSATPSLTSFHKIPHFRLKGTFFESNSKVSYDEGEHGLSHTIIQAIEKSLSTTKQVVVFLPTRANFKYITCKVCGANVECPYCAVGMSLHQKMNALKCHYCNYTEVIPKQCPKCGCEEIQANRMGTAQVNLALQEHFKTYNVQQFDRDEVRTQKQLESVLERFKSGEIHILVGTQMLSKGHDYHGVGLAVIIGIDALLGMSDFRAREKTLALVKQIAGRSGRKGYGEVLIQTKNAAFFKDYLDNFEGFLKDELVYRKDLYPPFKKMLRLMSAHAKEEKAKSSIDAVLNSASHFKNVEIVGYGKSGISKIAGKYRYELLARSDSSKALLEFAHSVKSHAIEVDIDPLSFS